MEVQTVLGRIQSGEMGVTLTHEHVFIDLRSLLVRPGEPSLEWLAEAKVSFEIFGDLLHHGMVCGDNLILDDAGQAVRELAMFKRLGGGTVVDMTSRGLKPRPAELREVSRRTGLNIIAGCGYYVAAAHPPDMGSRAVDEIAEEMVKDLTEGIDGSGVKAGVIGEIGTSHPVEENERKVLRAAAAAHKSTGASINVHVSWRGRHASEALRLLESEGVDPARVIVSHMDVQEGMPFDLHRDVAERGAYVEFDCFGEEEYIDELNYMHPRDSERVAALKRLVDAGYTDRLLVSQDVCAKMYTRTYGGYGYDHIQRTIVPMLKRAGVSDAEVRRITVENPARAIAH